MRMPPEQQLRAFVRLTVSFALTAPLSSRLANGDAELTALFDEVGVDVAEASRTQAMAFIVPMVEAANPDLPEQACLRITRLLSALLTITGRLRDPVLGASGLQDDIPDMLADILASGVSALEPS